eukprot:scaffold321166_cov37-Tisochrysis_lutea.AAC.1
MKKALLGLLGLYGAAGEVYFEDDFSKAVMHLLWTWSHTCIEWPPQVDCGKDAWQGDGQVGHYVGQVDPGRGSNEGPYRY